MLDAVDDGRPDGCGSCSSFDSADDWMITSAVLTSAGVSSFSSLVDDDAAALLVD